MTSYSAYNRARTPQNERNLSDAFPSSLVIHPFPGPKLTVQSQTLGEQKIMQPNAATILKRLGLHRASPV